MMSTCIYTHIHTCYWYIDYIDYIDYTDYMFVVYSSLAHNTYLYTMV